MFRKEKNDEQLEVVGAEAASNGVEAPSPEPVEAPPGDGLQKLQAERDSLFERMARQQAEFENLRKRMAKEKADFRDLAMGDAANQLIPIIDSLDLALKSGVSGDDLRKGVELIRKQMDDVLARLGVTPVAAEGAEFDPHVHEAIEMVETEEAEDNHVLDELRRGYKIKERLLRPAMVRVARNHKK